MAISIAELLQARKALLSMSDEAILALLQGWLEKWAEPLAEIGPDVDALCESTRWPKPHLEEALRRAFRPWQYGLREVISGLHVQTGRPREDAWLCAVLAGRIPALATAIVMKALLARLPVVLKPSSKEPLFAQLLAKSAKRHSELLGSAICVTHERAVALEAPLCVAYGHDQTIEAIRKARGAFPTWCAGHRESIVVVLREALETLHHVRLLAAKIAEDVSIYDQDGCLSPHLVLCEESGNVCPETFARALYESLQDLCAKLPLSKPTQHELFFLRTFLEESKVTVRVHGGVLMHPKGSLYPLVCLLPEPYRPGPGFRVVQVIPFRDVPDLATLAPSLCDRLQGIAFAGSPESVREIMRKAPLLSAPYVCDPGALQNPPPNWRENWLDLLAELIAASQAHTAGHNDARAS